MRCIYVIRIRDHELAFNIQHAVSNKMIVKLESMPSTLTFFWIGDKMSKWKMQKMKKKNSNLRIYSCDKYSEREEMLKMYTNIITMTGNRYMYNVYKQECCHNLWQNTEWNCCNWHSWPIFFVFIFIFIMLHLFQTQFNSIWILNHRNRKSLHVPHYTVLRSTLHCIQVICICFTVNKIDMHLMLWAEHFKCTEMEIAIVYALRLLPLLLS